VPAQPSVAPAEVDRLSRVAPQQDEEKKAAAPVDQVVPNAGSRGEFEKAPAKLSAESTKQKGMFSASAGAAASSLQAEKNPGPPADAREVQLPAAPPPPAPAAKTQSATEGSIAPQAEARAKLAAPATAQVQTNVDEIGGAPSQDKQKDFPKGEPSAVPGSSAKHETFQEAQSTRQDNQAIAAFRAVREYPSLLKAPSGSILWRAGKGGIVERSGNAGKTWAPQMSSSTEDWLAGAAVSDTVCWLVGRNGAIARTTDGNRWESITPPAQAVGRDGKLPDWTGITARDAQSATVTASSGQRFATQDGGKTWQAQ